MIRLLVYYQVDGVYKDLLVSIQEQIHMIIAQKGYQFSYLLLQH